MGCSYFCCFSGSIPGSTRCVMVCDVTGSGGLGVRRCQRRLLSRCSTGRVSAIRAGCGVLEVAKRGEGFGRLFRCQANCFGRICFRCFVATFILFTILLVAMVLTVGGSNVVCFGSVLLLIYLVIYFKFTTCFLCNYVGRQG